MNLVGLFLAVLRRGGTIRQVTVLRIPCALVVGLISAEMKLQYALYAAMLMCQHLRLVFGDEDTRTYKITDKVYTCSSWLSALINKFCDTVYKIVKRDTSIMIDKLTPRSLQEQRNKERVLAEERWRRVRRQIATECCDQPCTVANIIKYCPDGAKLIKERPDFFE